MITVTTLPTFPTCPTYGFTSQPDYLVKIVTREGGFERRDRKWSQPLHYYEGMPTGDRPQRDIETLLKFWHAMGGTYRKFRFKDWADYKSCGLDDEVEAIDQPVALVSGSPGGYQLYKRYDHEGLEQLRKITRPNGSTIKIANHLGAEQPSSSWTIEEDTGLLVPNGGFVGTPAGWGGEFFVPCRFDSQFKTEIVNYKIMNLTVSIREVREVSQ